MTYQSRIPVDQGYVKGLGTAFYNFTYLEWTAIWIIVKLSASGFHSVPTGKTARYIATALKNAIDTTSPPISAAMRKRLLDFHQSFVTGGWPTPSGCPIQSRSVRLSGVEMLPAIPRLPLGPNTRPYSRRRVGSNWGPGQPPHRVYAPEHEEDRKAVARMVARDAINY